LKTICFTHTDLDGHAAGAVVRHFIPEVQIIPINYGEPFPWDEIDTDTKVYMTDYSLQPWIKMELLMENCKELIWIDHHQSAIDDYKASGLEIHGIQRVGIGACQLAWEWFTFVHGNRTGTRFNGPTNVPDAIQLLAQWDVWDHSDPRSNHFQYGMRALQTDPSQDKTKYLWDMLLGDHSDDLVAEICESGHMVYAYAMKSVRGYVANYSFDTEIEGLRAVAVNKMNCNSLAFEDAFDPERHDCMLSFGWTGSCWTVSLYSKSDGPDVSKIAKSWGGGGHRCAAGFQVKSKCCNDLPFKI
jgi:oligoribonuclease NrnB/cAMP/cGMP phosphodiesterase (DHH superfamily)